MADILEVAMSSGSFKTLTRAVSTAGLTETLKGKGPFTVFAPSDEAFAKLPSSTVDALLKEPYPIRSINIIGTTSVDPSSSWRRAARARIPEANTCWCVNK